MLKKLGITDQPFSRASAVSRERMDHDSAADFVQPDPGTVWIEASANKARHATVAQIQAEGLFQGECFSVPGEDGMPVSARP